jgi:hypothetical protein
MDWIELAEDRDRWRAAVNTVMNVQFPYDGVNLLTSWGTVSLSRRTLLRGVSGCVTVTNTGIGNPLKHPFLSECYVNFMLIGSAVQEPNG